MEKHTHSVNSKIKFKKWKVLPILILFCRSINWNNQKDKIINIFDRPVGEYNMNVVLFIGAKSEKNIKIIMGTNIAGINKGDIKVGLYIKLGLYMKFIFSFSWKRS